MPSKPPIVALALLFAYEPGLWNTPFPGLNNKTWKDMFSSESWKSIEAFFDSLRNEPESKRTDFIQGTGKYNGKSVVGRSLWKDFLQDPSKRRFLNTATEKALSSAGVHPRTIIAEEGDVGWPEGGTHIAVAASEIATALFGDEVLFTASGSLKTKPSTWISQLGHSLGWKRLSKTYVRARNKRDKQMRTSRQYIQGVLQQSHTSYILIADCRFERGGNECNGPNRDVEMDEILGGRITMVSVCQR